jgi:phage portal protein BeeE
MKVVSETTKPLDLGSILELRLDDMPAENTKAAKTDDAVVMVPWPLEPLKIVQFYLGSPWLGAIGGLLADAVASAAWELVPRETDLAGKLITREQGFRKDQDDDYGHARAWLSREDIGGDGVSQLDLPGLLRAMSAAYDQNSNIFCEIIRDRAGTRPMRIQHLLPQFVHYRARDGQLELYQMDPFRGEFSFVPFGTRGKGEPNKREYIHQRCPNTVSSYYGIPFWYPSKESVEVDNEHRSYLKGFFKRHTTPRYMIEISQDPEWTGGWPSEEQVDEVYVHVKSFLSANAGEMAGRNLIIRYPGGIRVKATPLDNKLEDPTFPNTSKNMRDEIMAVRHISLSNLGSPEGTNRATAQEHSDNFRNDVLKPFAAPAVAIINRILHAPEPHGLGIETYDFELKFERVDDLLKRIEAVVRAVGGPVLTQPEGRQVLGYEAKGSDALFIPVNMVPALEFSEGGPDGDVQ